MLALLLLALLAGRAAAQNADDILMGMEAATTGGAVLTTKGDAAAAFYNPSGVASLGGSSVQVSGSAYSISALRLGHFVDTKLPWTTTDQSVRSTSLYSVPAVAAYGFRVQPGLGVAVGVWVPSHEVVAATADLQSEGAFAPGGSVTRASYEQHLSITEKIDRTYFGAAAGLALGARLRVGLSGFVTYDSAEAFVSVAAAATTDSPVPAERGATFSVTSSGVPAQFAVRFGGGVQWDAAPWLTLALAVKTPSLLVVRSGSVFTTSELSVLLPGSPPTIAFVHDSGAPLRLTEPWRLAAGGAAVVGAWSLRAEGDWQSAIAGQRAVGNARVGALHDGGDIRWGAGIFTDLSRQVASSDALRVDYYGATAGLFYRPPPVQAARARGGAWDLWTNLAVRYAYGVGQATGFAIAPLGGEVAVPTAKVRVDVVTVTLGGLVQF